MLNFKPKTIDSVLSAFNTAIADLRELATKHDDIAAEKRKEAAELKAQADAADVEAARAGSIADKMTAVFTLGN